MYACVLAHVAHGGHHWGSNWQPPASETHSPPVVVHLVHDRRQWGVQLVAARFRTHILRPLWCMRCMMCAIGDRTGDCPLPNRVHHPLWRKCCMVVASGDRTGDRPLPKQISRPLWCMRCMLVTSGNRTGDRPLPNQSCRPLWCKWCIVGAIGDRSGARLFAFSVSPFLFQMPCPGCC